MTSPYEVLENHTLVVRNGRIIDVVPTGVAAERYAAAVHVERPGHLLMPGLVNAYTRLAPPPGRRIAPEQLRDAARLCIAAMLEAGTTCFCSVDHFPEEAARAAAEQGMRAVIGSPIAETAGPWAQGPDEYLARGLNLRDEYRGHPNIATAFAPLSSSAIGDGTFARIATLADELDTGIVTALHASRAEVDESVIRHGVRPIERLHALGLLTPALTAVHMAHVTADDMSLAQRSGIAVTLCPEADLRSGNGSPPVASWTATGLRLGLGTGGDDHAGCADLWSAVRLLALLSNSPDGAGTALQAWNALAAATRGGAAALGLETDIGTLEQGKWADVCCVDLHRPAMQWTQPAAPREAVTGLVWNGGRDLVSDVWVSGRQLLNSGAFTRLDWPQVAGRVNAAHRQSINGE